MAHSGMILLAVQKDGTIRVALPPANKKDSFLARSNVVGKIENATHVVFSPDNKLYVVRGAELYQGGMPSSNGADWFKEAKCVAKADWDKFKCIVFHPKGTLYAATHEGELYKGPPPTNENVSWLYTEATKVGNAKWNIFHALFFDPEGVLYGVTNDQFLKAPPPKQPTFPWVLLATQIGRGDIWAKLCHFISFTPDGNLWAVNKDDGNLYMGPPPTNKDEKWITTATNLGSDFHLYKFLSFTQDTTIQKLLTLEFLADLGRVTNVETELVTEQVYDNKDSSTPLNSTFSVNQAYTMESKFGHEHGFALGHDAEAAIVSAVPCYAGGKAKIGVSACKTANWKFTDTNKIEKCFNLSSNFVVEPGQAVAQRAEVRKATLEVPYHCKVLTDYGYEKTIAGTWTGAHYHDLRVKQINV